MIAVRIEALTCSELKPLEETKKGRVTEEFMDKIGFILTEYEEKMIIQLMENI
jgi:hypothetical protein